MNRILLLLFILLCTTLHLVNANPDYHWEFAGWYGGGCFTNIEFDPHIKDRLYLSSDVAGIWRSDDLGENWRFITKGLGNLTVAQIAMAPSDSNILYATTSDGVYYSLDAGSNWQASDTAGKKITFVRPANYRSLTIDANNPSHVCIATAKEELYCSNNYGQSWNEIIIPNFVRSNNEPIPALFFGQNNTSLVAAFKEEVARYDFKTQAWQELGQFKAISDAIIDQDDLYVVSDNRVWFKMANQASWSRSEAIPRGNAYRLALSKGQKKVKFYLTWLKDWHSGIFMSDDSGQSWQDLHSHFNPDIKSNPTRQWANASNKNTSIKIDPFDPNVIFTTDFWGIWRSDDQGRTWYEKIKGAPNTVASDIVISPSDTIFVGSMDNGLLGSPDEGKSYKCLFPQKYPLYAGHVWRIVLSGNTLIGTLSSWNSKTNQVIISHDNGKSFKLTQEGLPYQRPKQNTMWQEGYPRALAIDPQDPQTVYLGIDGDDAGGLYISKNGGQSWTRSLGQPGSVRVYHGLKVDPTNSNIIVWGACGKNGGVYISLDKGKSFKYFLKSMPWVFNIDISPNGTIYASGNLEGPALFVKTKTDEDFHPLAHFAKSTGDAIDGLAINPQNTKIIAISTVSWVSKAPCKYFLTQNGGNDWQEINGDLPQGAGASAMTFDQKGQYLYIARYAGSVYKLKI